MSVQGWADATRQVKAYQDVEHQRIIDVYQSLLHGKIIPNTAADTISSIYNPLLQQGTRSESVITLWYILCDAVRVLGGDTELAERLIMLINCITKLPDVTDMQGNAITPEWKGAGVYWRDLPQLAMIFRSHAIDIDDEVDGDWNDVIKIRLNVATFGAMYFARGKQPIGMAFHAEQRDAIMYVPPAATWILIAGEKIHALCKVDHERRDGAPGCTRYHDEWLWGKGRGYSLERWALWKKRFHEILATQGLKDSIRDIAAKAAFKTEEIETS